MEGWMDGKLLLPLLSDQILFVACVTVNGASHNYTASLQSNRYVFKSVEILFNLCYADKGWFCLYFPHISIGIGALENIIPLPLNLDETYSRKAMRLNKTLFLICETCNVFVKTQPKGSMHTFESSDDANVDASATSVIHTTILIVWIFIFFRGGKYQKHCFETFHK